MKMFQAKPFLDKEDIHQLTLSLNITERRVRKWFEKKRSEERRKGSLHKGE